MPFVYLPCIPRCPRRNGIACLRVQKIRKGESMMGRRASLCPPMRLFLGAPRESLRGRGLVNKQPTIPFAYSARKHVFVCSGVSGPASRLASLHVRRQSNYLNSLGAEQVATSQNNNINCVLGLDHLNIRVWRLGGQPCIGNTTAESSWTPRWYQSHWQMSA